MDHDIDINAVIRSLWVRIRERDFSLAFFVDVVTLALWALEWLNEPEVIGDRVKPETTVSLVDLHVELTGNQPAATGLIPDLLLRAILVPLIEKAIEVIADSGLPTVLVELLTGWLKDILSKL